ncbi:MAG TPA: flagellar biosynthesis protein FlhB [Caulobacteraceae bacterium]|jgi:flagellar biosynthetic protein FlhB
MAGENDAASKTEEPTPRRLEEARRKGDVAKSMDLPAFASLAGAAGVLAVAGGWMGRNLTLSLLPFVQHPETMNLQGAGGVEVMRAAALAAAPIILMVLGAAAACGVFGNLVQHGVLWTGAKLKPELSKVSPLSGFKRIFGVDGLVQFLKSTLKIVLVAAIAWMVLKPRSASWRDLAALEPTGILPTSIEPLRALVFAVACALGVGALLDWLWQRHRFMQRMRMSREELKEDMRQSDGDPHVKARLRQLRVERSRKRMIQNVPKATVVVTNPTHYAIALRYEAGETAAPVCLAKGVDALALRIRETAQAHQVPVIEDPPLARALYATVEVDQAIPQQHYQAVAKIIGFVMSAARAKRRS